MGAAPPTLDDDALGAYCLDGRVLILGPSNEALYARLARRRREVRYVVHDPDIQVGIRAGE